MKFKGTKGQWVISPSSDNYIADISDNFAIAKAFNNSFIQKGECEANAKLIASAPELLEVLIELVELKQLKFNDGEYPSDEYIKRKPIAWDNAKKVLEKALT